MLVLEGISKNGTEKYSFPNRLHSIVLFKLLPGPELGSTEDAGVNLKLARLHHGIVLLFPLLHCKTHTMHGAASGL